MVLMMFMATKTMSNMKRDGDILLTGHDFLIQDGAQVIFLVILDCLRQNSHVGLSQ